MKAIKYLLALAAVGGMMTACSTDIENESIQNPYTYSPQYYQNLRDYKASDHSIAFMWFAQYGAQNSMAVRFAGLPDSLDICSLWGGIPAKENTQIWDELRFVQKTKGTKMLVVAITRIDAEIDEIFANAGLTDKDALIITYCTGGVRGANVAELLADRGFTNVNVYTCGFAEWAGDKKAEVEAEAEVPKAEK